MYGVNNRLTDKINDMNKDVRLTKRENQIAELIAWGSAKKEIADLLCISVSTVDNTARSIYEKIGINKSNELSAWWFCRTYKVPFEDAPLFKFSKARKAVIAFILLCVIVPREIFSTQDTVRVMRRCSSGRRVSRVRSRDFEIEGMSFDIEYC